MHCVPHCFIVFTMYIFIYLLIFFVCFHHLGSFFVDVVNNDNIDVVCVCVCVCVIYIMHTSPKQIPGSRNYTK